jgi:hypothetical protein
LEIFNLNFLVLVFLNAIFTLLAGVGKYRGFFKKVARRLG